MVEDWMSISSINLDFFENWEISFVGIKCPFAHSFRIFWLLASKLIAWKSKDFKSMTSKLLFQLNKLLIMLSSVTTFWGNIHNKSTFQVFQKLIHSSFSFFVWSKVLNWDIESWLRWMLLKCLSEIFFLGGLWRAFIFGSTSWFLLRFVQLWVAFLRRFHADI